MLAFHHVFYKTVYYHRFKLNARSFGKQRGSGLIDGKATTEQVSMRCQREIPWS